jgi:solute carrier family 25 iron transporter 28/37
MRHIVSQAGTGELDSAAGMTRLWRGVYTIFIGCIPAHALYFSTYEATKCALLQENGDLSAQGGMVAGAAAATSHDLIMAPLDTVKQRLQLGHYGGMMDAFRHMLKFEGYAGLFRSFPITLLTNIPYGMVMVSTNEVLKQRMMHYYDKPQLDVSTCLVASSVAGMTAAASTTPLDRIKTFLQTQQLQPACNQGSCPKLTGDPITCWRQAVKIILQKEGPAGLFKGMAPRVITHTPAVAISWTTYETVKRWLANHYS